MMLTQSIYTESRYIEFSPNLFHNLQHILMANRHPRDTYGTWLSAWVNAGGDVADIPPSMTKYVDGFLLNLCEMDLGDLEAFCSSLFRSLGVYLGENTKWILF